MSVMEFVLVAHSIIVGLAVAEILRGVADIFRTERIEINYRLLFIAGWTLLLLLQVWWSIWRVGVRTTWTFPEFLMFLLPVAILSIIARLCFPKEASEKDLHAYFGRVGKVIFLMVAATYASFAFLLQPFVFGGILPVVFASQLALVALATIAAFLRTPWFQVMVIAAMFAQVLWRGLSSVIGN